MWTLSIRLYLFRNVQRAKRAKSSLRTSTHILKTMNIFPESQSPSELNLNVWVIYRKKIENKKKRWKENTHTTTKKPHHHHHRNAPNFEFKNNSCNITGNFGWVFNLCTWSGPNQSESRTILILFRYCAVAMRNY